MDEFDQDELTDLADEGLRSRVDRLKSEPYETYSTGDAARMPGVEWVIPGAVQHGELTSLYGGRGSGKSLVALDMGLRRSKGLSWHGQDVDRGRTLFVALENVHAMPDRLKYWEERFGQADPEWFRWMREPVRVSNHTSVTRLAATALAMPSPPLLIVDTQQRFEVPWNENATQDMAAMVEIIDRFVGEGIVDAFVLVHHSGKRASSGARGSVVIEASATSLLKVSKTRSLVTLEAEKVNNGPEGWSVRWNIEADPDPDAHGATVVPTLPDPTSNGQLDPADEIGLEQAILEVIDAHPDGLSKGAVVDAVGRNEGQVRSLLDTLAEGGQIRMRRGARNAKLCLPAE